MGVGKYVEGDGGIRHFSSRGYFVNRKAGNAVHQDMVFITPVKLILFSFIWLEAVWTPSLHSLSAFGWLSALNLLERKDLGLFCDVLAETGVESRPMKEVSMMPFFSRNKTCDFMMPDRMS